MRLREFAGGKLSFIKEEGFEPSPPEVQTLENEIRENKHS